MKASACTDIQQGKNCVPVAQGKQMELISPIGTVGTTAIKLTGLTVPLHGEQPTADKLQLYRKTNTLSAHLFALTNSSLQQKPFLCGMNGLVPRIHVFGT